MEDWLFYEVNEKFCNDFREYLLTTKSNKSDKVCLSQNSAVSYFNKFKATLKQAFKEGYLQINLNSKIEMIKPAETHRNFLSIEELKQRSSAGYIQPHLYLLLPDCFSQEQRWMEQ